MISACNKSIRNRPRRYCRNPRRSHKRQTFAVQGLPPGPSAGFNSRAMAKKKTSKRTKVPKTTATHAPRKATAKPVDTAVERVLETENAPTVEQGPAPSASASSAPPERQAGVMTG